MNNRVYFPQNPIEPLKPGNKVIATNGSTTNASNQFEKILTEQMTGSLKVSNHAQQRMKSRNIELSPSDLGKVQEAVNRARSKGAKDSLILMNGLALVVSVKNNTIITAVDGESLKENVFTNIDSAVIV